MKIFPQRCKYISVDRPSVIGKNVCNLSERLPESATRRMLRDDMCNLMGRCDNMFTQMLRFAVCPSGKLGRDLLGHQV